MMKFLTFPCLAILSRQGSDVQHCVSVSVLHPPLGWSCTVLKSWLRFSGFAEGPSYGLMWAQLYEKHMSIDWKKTFPSSIEAQAHQANSYYPSISKRNSTCWTWFTWTYLWFSSVQQGNRSTDTSLPAIFLSVLCISQSKQSKIFTLLHLGKIPLWITSYPICVFVGLVSDSLQFFFSPNAAVGCIQSSA